MSDAKIYPFKGMVGCAPEPPASRIREIEQICKNTKNSQFPYVVKFKSGDIHCLIDNAKISNVSVFREDTNGTLSEVQFQPCEQ